jgi:hypothetical protein
MGSNGVLEYWSNGKDVALKTDIDLSYNTPSLQHSKQYRTFTVLQHSKGDS